MTHVHVLLAILISTDNTGKVDINAQTRVFRQALDCDAARLKVLSLQGQVGVEVHADCDRRRVEKDFPVKKGK